MSRIFAVLNKSDQQKFSAVFRIITGWVDFCAFPFFSLFPIWTIKDLHHINFAVIDFCDRFFMVVKLCIKTQAVVALVTD